MHFTKQSHWGMYYFMTYLYTWIYTHKFFLVKGSLWHTSMYVFDKHFHATSHIYVHFWKAPYATYSQICIFWKAFFYFYFLLPIQHIQIFERHFCYLSNIYKFLKGIFCYIFTHFARHFFMLYIFTYFARYFHAIYIHICTYYWKAFFMLPRCKVFLMRQQIQILVKKPLKHVLILMHLLH